MSRLVSISARNLKGATFDLQLAPVTFIVGKNYVGKSARTDAIRLLLAGFLPELGKTNGATFGLSSGKILTVDGILASGVSPNRTWSAQGDSVRRVDNVGDSFGDAALSEVMLNAESWFGLTETERVDWVFKNCNVASGFDRSKIEERVVNGEDPAPSRKIWAKILAAVAAEESDGPLGINAFVSAALEAAGKVAKDAKVYAIQMDKTAAGLASLRASDVAPIDVAALESEIKAIEAEIEILRNQAAGASAKIEEEARYAQRRVVLTRETADKFKYEATLKTLRDVVESFAATADKLKKELEAMPAHDPQLLLDRRAEDRLAAAEWAALRADLVQVVSAIAKNEGDKTSIDDQKTCPYCGASGEGWKALKLAEVNSTLAGLRSKRETLEEAVSRAASKVDEIGRRIKGIEEAVAARMVLMNKIQEADRSVAKAKSDVETSERFIAGFAVKEGELSAIPAATPNLLENRQALIDALRDKQTKAGALGLDRRNALGRDHDKKRLAEAEKNRDDAKAEQIVATIVVDALKVVKAEMVAEAFKPLIEVANLFAGPLLKEPLVFNAEKSEIGSFISGVWVGHKTFSGVEKLIAYAAIQAAFASRAPVRVMILDELLRAEGDVLAKLIAQCKMAVRSRMIDNFVGILPGSDSMALRAALVVDEDPAFAQIVEVK